MAIDLEFYLESVVEAAVGVLQVYERGGDSEDSYKLDIDNDLLTLLSKIAYGQINSFLNRAPAIGNYVDIYTRIQYGELFQIRNYPVKSVTSVLLNGLTLTENVDYILEGGKYFQLLGSPDTLVNLFTTGGSFDKGFGKDLRITYKGGWEEASENAEVASGLTLQTIGLYHRKDTLGIGSIKGASFNGSSAAGSMSLSPLDPDAGGLLSAARLAVERYKFYGTCLTMDLD